MDFWGEMESGGGGIFEEERERGAGEDSHFWWWKWRFCSTLFLSHDTHGGFWRFLRKMPTFALIFFFSLLVLIFSTKINIFVQLKFKVKILT